MKKRIFFFCVILVFILGLQTGCSKNGQNGKMDWEEKIRADFFYDQTDIEEVMADVVSIKVKQDETKLTVTVKAPDICDELLDWMDSVSDEAFTESAMEAEILQLLKKSEKVETEHVLTFSNQDESVKITYTSEFSEVISCGLTRFYAEVTQRVLEEMGDSAK